MAGFVALLGLSALFYRAATFSATARGFAMTGRIADVLGVGIVAAVPIILWFRWHGLIQKASDEHSDESPSRVRPARTILGLHDYSPPPLTSTNGVADTKESIAPEVALVMQPLASVETTPDKQNELPIEPPRNETMEMDNLNPGMGDGQPQPTQPTYAQPENAQPPAQPPAAPQPAVTGPMMSHSFPTQPVPTPMSPQQPMQAQPMQPAQPPMPQSVTQPSSPERPNVPAVSFRDQLYALNARWQQIEESGREIEDWFQRQQRRVFAHLERPSAKAHESHVELSQDFLEQKMNKVDAEWAAIHQTVREMYRWLENGNSEKETAQQTKVW
jgi:hypothetical protein